MWVITMHNINSSIISFHFYFSVFVICWIGSFIPVFHHQIINIIIIIMVVVVFRYLNVLPEFQLLEVGRGPDNFWRKYILRSAGITCELKEVFPNDALNINWSNTATQTDTFFFFIIIIILFFFIAYSKKSQHKEFIAFSFAFWTWMMLMRMRMISPIPFYADGSYVRTW